MMIWIRRGLVAPLGLLLLFLLAVALVAMEASDTFLNPGYYPRELQKANFYEFVMVDIATSAVDEARQINGEAVPERLDENPIEALGLSTEDIVGSLNEALPPEWLQALVEQVFDELGRYVVGQRDEFQIEVQAGEQAVAMVSEVKYLLRKADAYGLLFESFVTPAVDDALDSDVPLGLSVTSERLVESVRTAIPPEWVEAQVEAALDEVTPYFVGEKDSFEIRVQLADNLERALGEVKQLLRETDAYELLYDDVVGPTVTDNLGAQVELPLGIAVTDDEVLSALRQVAPPEWVQLQAERVIDEAGPYLAGETESFSITVPLEENKLTARAVIIEAATAKLEQAIGSLPQCTAAQQSLIPQEVLDSLPICLPQGYDHGDLMSRMGSRVGDAVDDMVLSAIPDEYNFTDQVLRDALLQAGDAENVKRLDEVRRVMKEGWTYTDLDLRRDLFDIGGDEAVQRLDDLRTFLTDGWTYTDADLREDLASDGESLDDLDRARSMFGRARSLRLLTYLPVVLLLVGIGFLGGTHWQSRVAWAAGALAVTAGIIFLLSWPVYNAVGKSRVENAADSALSGLNLDGDFVETKRLAAEKGSEIVRNSANGFASGLAIKSSFLLVIGLLALAVSLGWDHIREFAEEYGPRLRR